MFLISPSKLTVSDCATLVEKISARANSWASEKSSFAGRIQFIFSVALRCIGLAFSSCPKKRLKLRSRNFVASCGVVEITIQRGQGSLGASLWSKE